nr:RNA-directed DNA polymerase, eukaryota, reverse transcriptase zinc-binding domain protein [Tanacetum cinerariifolium]
MLRPSVSRLLGHLICWLVAANVNSHGDILNLTTVDAIGKGDGRCQMNLKLPIHRGKNNELSKWTINVNEEDDAESPIPFIATRRDQQVGIDIISFRRKRKSVCALHCRLREFVARHGKRGRDAESYYAPRVLVTCRSRQVVLVGNENENVPLYYHIVNNLQIQFGREEFCLVTGLRFGVEYWADYDNDEDPIPFRRRVLRFGVEYWADYDNDEDPIPFRRRVFPLSLDGEHIIGKIVETLIDSKLFDRFHNDDDVSLCCVGILQLVFLGVEDRRIVPEWILRLANDRVGWDKYPWGSYSATPFMQPAMSSHPGTYNWQSHIPSHMGNPNSQTPIETHPDGAGLLDHNIPNRGKREQRPSMYRRTPYVKQPSTTVLPKQRGNKNKNKVHKATVLPLNLGNVFDDDNEGSDDIMFVGGQFTSNMLVYENVDPNKTRTGQPSGLVVRGRREFDVQNYCLGGGHKQAPISVINKLESMRGHFSNGHEPYSKKATWTKWSSVLASKAERGLGVPSFFALNRALMLKWVWRFHAQGSSFWARIIKAIHGNKGQTVSKLPASNGNGSSISFWNDQWIGDRPLRDLFSRLYSLEDNKNAMVNVKLLDGNGAEQAQLNELSILVSDVNLRPISDRCAWSLEGSGDFSVASIRKVIDGKRFSKVSSKTRWIKSVPNKVNILAWKVKLDGLPTRLNISRRVSQIPSHIGNPNSQTPIETHPDAAGLLDQNIPNRGKRKHRPSMYRQTPYVEQPPTTVLPKQRVPTSFWRQLAPYLCMPDIYRLEHANQVGWLSGDWMELLIRSRLENASWIVAKTGTVKDKRENDKIETKPDKNEKHEKARQCKSPVTVKKAEKEKKIQTKGTNYENPESCQLSRVYVGGSDGGRGEECGMVREAGNWGREVYRGL